MSSIPIHYKSIQEIHNSYLDKIESPLSVTNHFLDRIQKIDKDFQSYATVMFDEAISEAEELSNQFDSNSKLDGKLFGIPVAVKDLCYTKGIQTMGGTAVLEGVKPDFDSTVVRKLKSAGAIILGKLNLTEGAMGGYNPKRAVPKNPWNRDKWTGSSSSGSGVATSAGLCVGSLGSDTGGSIRFPSSACGLVGIKPTYGRVSRYGVLDLAESLDHVGPMTRNVEDAALILSAISGYDPNDPTSLTEDAPEVRFLADLTGFTLGYCEEFAEDGVDPEIVKVVKDALNIFENAGATIKKIDLESIDHLLPSWNVLCTAEAFNAHSEYFPSRADEYGPWFREWLQRGSQVSASEYIEASKKRLLCNSIINNAFNDIDVLITPTVIRLPHDVDDSISYGPMDDRRGTAFQRFTVPFDYNGFPTISVPAGYSLSGLPLSIQIVGKQMQESTICKIAERYQDSVKGIWKNPIP
ncbi:MAG: amidase [Dehalococcoidia bacterium]